MNAVPSDGTGTTVEDDSSASVAVVVVEVVECSAAAMMVEGVGGIDALAGPNGDIDFIVSKKRIRSDDQRKRLRLESKDVPPQDMKGTGAGIAALELERKRRSRMAD